MMKRKASSVAKSRTGKRMKPIPVAARYANKASGYVDLAVSNYNCDTTGSIALIATIPQGTSVNQRVGKKAMYKSLQVRGLVRGENTTLYNKGVVLIVYDRLPTGTLPSVTDILDTANANSFNNDANSDRFKIIRRMEFPIVGNVATAGQGTDSSLHCVDEYIDLSKYIVQFKAAGTGAIADISKGSLLVVTAGLIAAGSADTTATLGFRTRFVDING